MKRDEWLRIGRKYLNVLWDLMFPPYCLVCEKAGVSFICPECVFKLEANVSLKVTRLKSFNVSSICTYADPIKRLIWLIKFRNKFVLTPIIQDLVVGHFPEEFKKVDYIVPVPIHKNRRKDRGFNQAEEFIKKAAAKYSIPILPDCLVRPRSTRSLYELNKAERARTMAGTITCTKPESILNKKLLIFDDILTTGATLTECGKVLKENGAGQILGVTICRA